MSEHPPNADEDRPPPPPDSDGVLHSRPASLRDKIALRHARITWLLLSSGLNVALVSLIALKFAEDFEGLEAKWRDPHLRVLLVGFGAFAIAQIAVAVVAVWLDFRENLAVSRKPTNQSGADLQRED